MDSNLNPDSDIPTENKNKEDLKPSIAERIGRWEVSKNNLTWIFGFLSLSIIGLFIAACFKECNNWIGNLIGVVGGLASTFGIYLTLCQLIQTKENVTIVTAISKATKSATEATRKAIKKSLSVSQVAKYCEQIKRIQEHYENNDLKIVIVLIYELQEAIIDLRKYLNSYQIEYNENAVAKHIQKMGMNISVIKDALERNTEYKRDEIRKDFQDLLKIMFELKAQLATHENERPQITV
ncbi:MAG: hypothetical protein K2N48_12635 [Muribaculaceae bacterium]|nr:hypothetical protein [Muribaculaceae bacterium]